jgi:hypothetical protein
MCISGFGVKVCDNAPEPHEFHISSFHNCTISTNSSKAALAKLNKGASRDRSSVPVARRPFDGVQNGGRQFAAPVTALPKYSLDFDLRMVVQHDIQ